MTQSPLVRRFAGVAALLAVAACARAWTSSAQAEVPDEVEFGSRTLALSPYLQGFPFERLVPLFEADLLVYDHVGAPVRVEPPSRPGWGPFAWLAGSRPAETQPARLWKAAPLSQATDLAAGQPLTDVDWDSRSRWSVRWHGPTRSILYTGDERNDERLNLYRLPVEGGAPQPLTDEPYLYGFGVSADEARIALVARRGEGPYHSCLQLLDAGGIPADRLCDTPEAAFTWGEPSWAPDGRGVVLRVNLEGRRDRGNLAWIPLDTPELQLLLDPGPLRRGAQALPRWVDDDRFVLTANATGADRIGLYDVRRAELTWLHTLQRELADLRLMRPGEEPILLAVAHRPDGDLLRTLDLDGAVLSEQPIDGTASVLGDDRAGRALIQWTSARAPFSTAWVDLDADGAIALTPWLSTPDDLAERIVHCEVEAVEFPTHDLDPETGEPRRLRGFLYTPRAPLDPPAVRVTAFYGGANRFDPDTQLWCEAGVATFSPAVRGSHGYGAAFAALNDGDLGGAEIADLFHAGRYLVSRGYPAERIGLYGRSHGGYAVMRALTFPDDAGHEVFPFAFGMAEAGFSDILTFHAASNIPDWVLLEAGDPATEADKLADRSPLRHIDRLQAPLLLVHGEADRRVPVDESRQMADACEAAGKLCAYLEIPGQGHRVRGLANEREVWQARMAFLQRVLQPE